MKNTGIKRTAVFLFAFAFAPLCLHAEKTARVVTTANSGAITSNDVKLQDMGENVFRLRISKEELSKGVKYVQVFLPESTAEKGDDGYWVLADGRMGHFTRDNGRIYEPKSPMSLYGVKKGDTAFVGIVKGLKYEFVMVVEVKEGKYRIFPSFHIADIGVKPYEDLIIDYTYFYGKDANYSSMGRAYRAYQLGRGEVKPLRERIKTQPTLAYTVKSVFFRVPFGNKVNKDRIVFMTPENEPPVRVNYTFDDFANMAKKLKALGVDETEMCFVGWANKGFEGRLPDLFPVEEKFGGEKKMREAIKTIHGLGFQAVCHVNTNAYYSCAKRFTFDDLAKTADGSLMKECMNNGGVQYNPCYECFYKKNIDEDIKGMLSLGLRGTHHIDQISAITPYPCHDPKHFCTRQQTADYMNAIGQKCKDAFGGFGSEASCDHVAKTLDFALYVWAYPQWLGTKNEIVDRLVPIWQIAYHGIILSNPYYATIDYTYSGDKNRSWGPYKAIMDKKIRRLKMAEFNGRPVFYLANYRKMGLDPVKEAYDEYKKMRHLQYEYLDFHDEIAKDVFISKFSNGESIVVNYSEADYSYDGNIVKAGDYALIKE